jgi:hypothetical protein
VTEFDVSRTANYKNIFEEKIFATRRAPRSTRFYSIIYPIEDPCAAKVVNIDHTGRIESCKISTTVQGIFFWREDSPPGN